MAMCKGILLFALLATAGCATPQERAAQLRAEMDEMIAVYGPACERLGYRHEDPGWRDCVMRLAARDDIRYAHPPLTSTTCFGSRGFFNCMTF
jgi:hypothetical protein